jgi:hypothetical protein
MNKSQLKAYSKKLNLDYYKKMDLKPCTGREFIETGMVYAPYIPLFCESLDEYHQRIKREKRIEKLKQL